MARHRRIALGLFSRASKPSTLFLPAFVLALLQVGIIGVSNSLTERIEVREGLKKGRKGRQIIWKTWKISIIVQSRIKIGQDKPYICIRTCITFSEGWGALEETTS